MTAQDEPILDFPERHPVRVAVLGLALVAALLWVGFQFLQPLPPRRIVLASGADFGIYHQYAQRYKTILARDGIVVEERPTAGARENLELLLDPKSHVDVAFMQGGIATFPAADDLVMLASLYYEPLWIFYGGDQTWTNLDQLRGHRIATGVPGQRYAGAGRAAAGRERSHVRQHEHRSRWRHRRDRRCSAG